MPILAYKLTEITEHWGMRGGHVISMRWLGVAAAVMLAAIGLLLLFQWLHRRRVDPGPNVLYHRIARLLGIGPADRRLLGRIASHQDLPSGLTLLCAASTLSFHADAYADTIAPRRREQFRRRIHDLARRLFEPPPPRATATAHDRD